MASFHKIAAALIALLCSCGVTRGDPDVTLVYKICNGDTSTTWAYNDSVDDLLQDIVDRTSNSGLFSYYVTRKGFWVHDCFGHGACNGMLARPDCDKCLRDAKQMIQSDCPRSVGAQLQLQDCRIRFENYQFNEG